jgi:hypothetical protein
VEHALACCERKREALHDCTCVCARTHSCALRGMCWREGAAHLALVTFEQAEVCAPPHLRGTCTMPTNAHLPDNGRNWDKKNPTRHSWAKAAQAGQGSGFHFNAGPTRDRREGRRMIAGGCTTRYVVRQVCRVSMTGVRGSTRVRAADRRKVVVRVDHRASQHAGTRASEERKCAC